MCKNKVIAESIKGKVQQPIIVLYEIDDGNMALTILEINEKSELEFVKNFFVMKNTNNQVRHDGATFRYSRRHILLVPSFVLQPCGRSLNASFYMAMGRKCGVW